MTAETAPYKFKQPYFKIKSSYYRTTGFFNKFQFHSVNNYCMSTKQIDSKEYDIPYP